MYKRKMFDNKLSADDRAVSPVVGVILMVAITVILAAVIGTFVLDLGSNQSAPPRAGFSFERGTAEDGGMSADTRSAVTATLTDPGNVEELTIKEQGTMNSASPPVNAGETVTFCESAADPGNDCDVVVTSDDDKLQVLGTSNGEEAVVSTYDYDLS